MSSRRLAIAQPDNFALSTAAKKEIAGWVKKYPGDRQRSALIPALWIAQKDAGGWLPEAALRELGDMLDMAYIRVYEVATFYTMFNLAPVGQHHIQLCGTTPCWLRGAGDLKAVCERKIGPKGSTSTDGKFSWVEVECLGACANAPMVQISNAAGDDYYEDLTPDTFETLLDGLSAGKAVKPGPQNDRHTSEPSCGAITLVSKGLYGKVKIGKLPNAGKSVKLTAYSQDPKGRRVTAEGRKSADKAAKPKSTKPKAARPDRSTKPAAKPKVLYTDGPTDGTPDDLKLIKGVGPKFEKELNANGVFYFRQIGAWKAADVKTVEDKIKSLASGRVKRDDWVRQGKALAKSSAKSAVKSAKKKA